jgi:uncharacterized protein
MTMDEPQPSWSVFQGTRRIAAGSMAEAVRAAKAAIDGGGNEPVMVLDDRTAQRVEVDFRNDIDVILARLPKPAPAEPAPDAPRGRGRPRIGVVAREVTLLPRHWEWLNRQPGGASVALRKLVEEARHTHRHRDRIRLSQEATYRFMTLMAGDRPGFEEAARALFAGNHVRFDAITGSWPIDIRDHAQRLASGAFAAESE